VETCDVGLVLDDLFREVRFGPAGDDPTVEWCVAGSIDHRPGHPGGGGVLFARSIPPRGGAPRRYDVVSFGGTRPGIEQLERRLAALGLHRIDVRMVQR
jgi:hypothetical protein